VSLAAPPGPCGAIWIDNRPLSRIPGTGGRNVLRLGITANATAEPTGQPHQVGIFERLIRSGQRSIAADPAICGDPSSKPLTGLATSVQAELVLVLEQTGLVRAVLMLACLHAAHNVVRRALHAALDAAPCRTSVPERQWLEQRSPTQPRIPERKRFVDARSFPIRFFQSCTTLSISTNG
jgi:hypothetical protein